MKLIICVTSALAGVASAGKTDRTTSSIGHAIKGGRLRAIFMGGLVASSMAQPKLNDSHMELVAMLEDRAKLAEGFAGFLAEYGDKPYARLAVTSCENAEPDCKKTWTVEANTDGDSSKSEFERRLQIFEDNVRLAVQRNEKPGNKAIHGVTKFMDQTDEEFVQKSTGLKVDWENDKEIKAFRESSTMYQPDPAFDPTGKSRDWRDEGVVTPVKDQGACGSCWAFSTTETMETAALKDGVLPKTNPFIGSPQEAVACDHFISMGCNGGNPLFALQYYRFRGLEPEKDFPYTSGTTGRAGPCKYDAKDGVLAVASTSVVSLMGFGEDNMVKHLLTEGPLSIAVYAEPWKTYKGGIMTADQCEGKMDHAVQLVGVNQDDPANPYWIVRNSWNTNWGEDGYIRLELGKNTCSIAFMSVGATVKKWESGEDVINV